MSMLALLALALQPAAPDARPGALHTYRDWVVGCDNALACKAVSLGSDAGPPPAVVITVERAAGPSGAILVRLVSETEHYRGRITLLVDGRAVAAADASDGEAQIGGPSALTAARALAAGRRVEARDAGGRRWSDGSLAGASAALRAMDEAQGRAGSRGAIVARGPRPDHAPTPPLPVVHRARASGTAAPLTPALIADMTAQAACSLRAREANPSFSGYPLGGGRTLVLFPCQLGAYNSVEAIFIVEGGRARPAIFDSAVPRSDNDRVPSLLNVDYGDGILGGYGKGRGLSDCGIGEDHVWDGARFRLISRREMTECRGTGELITTWRAIVR